MKLNLFELSVAFSSKSNKELKRAYLLFKLMKSKRLVNSAKKLLSIAMKTGIPVSWAVKPTIYRQFVGGKNIFDSLTVVDKLQQYNVKSILDYSVEGTDDSESMDVALEETLRTIDQASNNPNIPFTVFKPTAFASSWLLENAIPGKPFDDTMQNLYSDFHTRIGVLCQRAYEMDVPIMVDAEESWYQHLVDEIIEEMMAKYNKEKAIVFNTLQMYRQDRIRFFKEQIEKAKTRNYFLGVKLVRGAYMEKERNRALLKGYPSPICETKQQTDESFHQALKIALDHIDLVEIFCGSHNEQSIMLLANEMTKRNLKPDDRRIWFSQLYGMSDHITFNLAHHGFNACKYIPYGPVKSVIPYLFRRAEENSSITGQTTRELDLLKKERLRRKTHKV